MALAGLYDRAVYQFYHRCAWLILLQYAFTYDIAGTHFGGGRHLILADKADVVNVAKVGWSKDASESTAYNSSFYSSSPTSTPLPTPR